MNVLISKYCSICTSFLLKNLLCKDTFIITKGSGDTPIFVNMTIFIILDFFAGEYISTKSDETS